MGKGDKLRFDAENWMKLKTYMPSHRMCIRLKMSDRKGLDLDKLTMIDASEVPAKARRQTRYRDLLKKIRKGKALVISDNEANIDTIRAGIRRQQEHGDFKKIILAQRTNEQGVRILYVINPSEEQPDEKTS